MTRVLNIISIAAAMAWLSVGCSGDKAAPTPAEPGAAETAEGEGQAAAEQAGLKVGKGVDLATKTIKIGALNDESGPAASIGKPYALGKRILAAQVNAPGSGLLPEGWKVELVEKDHGYNPQKSVQAYNQLKDDVLFVATSFGTPNTLPLRPMLERDNMLALPASLSSAMAEHKSTIPLGTSYKYEAMRAMDYIVEQAGDAKKIKAGIVYQQDDYGKDGLDGWTAAAKVHGVEIVSEQTVTPGQRDFAAVVTGLKEAGATHVLLTVLPSASGPVLGTAAQLQYMPTWVGQTPAWIDRFFNKEVIPPAVFTNFVWVQSTPYWGEKIPGMDEFLKAYEAHGKDQGEPDFYTLLSYLQGRYGIEVINRAIKAGELTREGLSKAVTTVEGFTAGGLLQPLSTNKFPYVTNETARVLKPDFENKTWALVSDYAKPKAVGGAPGEAKGLEAAQAPSATGTPQYAQAH